MGPQVSQEPQVALQVILGRTGGCRAHDDAHVLGLELAGGVSQPVALAVGKPAADARALAVGRQHQEAAGQRQLHGYPCALRAHRILDHLHQHLLSRLQEILNPALAPFLGVEPREHHVVLVQKTVLGKADVDERGLHPRQHVVHLAEIDVADQRALAAALDQRFDGVALLEHGDA